MPIVAGKAAQKEQARSQRRNSLHDSQIHGQYGHRDRSCPALGPAAAIVSGSEFPRLQDDSRSAESVDRARKVRAPDPSYSLRAAIPAIMGRAGSSSRKGTNGCHHLFVDAMGYRRAEDVPMTSNRRHDQRGGSGDKYRELPPPLDPSQLTESTDVTATQVEHGGEPDWNEWSDNRY